jgi:hypothetical protein
MFNLRQVFAFWAVVACLIGIAGSAEAQMITVSPAGVTHSRQNRGNNLLNSQINGADCAGDDIMTFPLTLNTAGGTFSTDTLQTWVGTGCDIATNRTSTSQTMCWLVGNVSPSGLLNGAINVNVPVTTIVAGYTNLFGSGTAIVNGTAGAGGASGASGTSGTGGTDSSAVAGAGGATATAVTPLGVGQQVMDDPKFCNYPPGTAVAGATSVTIYFLLVNPSSFSADATATWTGMFKLLGPAAPDVVSAGIGGNLLVVNFSYSAAPGGASSVDQTINGFNIYCDPRPGDAAAVDAGLEAPDAGVGSAVSCAVPSSQVLAQGMAPPADPTYLCGSGQKTSQTADARGLVDGVAYNVAVAAFDTYANVGVLSKLACEVPQPITGFYKAYRAAGGTAGGGFCSFSPTGRPLPLFALLAVVAGLVLRRRRAA